MHIPRYLAAHDSGKCASNANRSYAYLYTNVSGHGGALADDRRDHSAQLPLDLRAPRSDDSYDDVVEMFAALRQMPAESHEYSRQRERIVARCLPLADHVASHFARRGEGLDDLTQVARLGLMNAVNRFDPDKGPSFIGFAVPTMMGEVRRYFRDYSWGMRVPRRLRELHVQISRTTSDLAQKLGRAPTAGELSQVLEVPHEEIVECLVAGDAYRLDSLDAPRGADSSGTPRLVADTVGEHRPTDRAHHQPGRRCASWWTDSPSANVTSCACGSSNR